MKGIGIVVALLALTPSFGSAAVDPAQWNAWKKEDAQFQQTILEAFPDGSADRSAVIRNLSLNERTAEDVDSVVRNEALSERLAISQAKVRGDIDADTASAETARLNKALEIHLCYIYGNFVPDAFAKVYGPYLHMKFPERISRADYVSLLRADPIQGHWGAHAFNLSQDLPDPAAGK